jgi:hypothetical protein
MFCWHNDAGRFFVSLRMFVTVSVAAISKKVKHFIKPNLHRISLYGTNSYWDAHILLSMFQDTGSKIMIYEYI